MFISFEEKMKLGVLQIVIIYVGVSTLWIYFSDSIVTTMTQDPSLIKRLSVGKGIFFILVTGMMLYTLLIKYVTELLNSYEELKKSHIRLERALSAANQGFYELNIKTGEATVSSHYWAMLGYNGINPVANLEWWKESMHPDDREYSLKILQECMSGGKSEYSICYRLKTKSGEWKWIESTGQIVQYDAEHKPLIMIGMHSDLDAKKRSMQSI